MKKLFLLILFVFLLPLQSFAQDLTELKKMAMNSEDVENCFQKNNSFLYCIFLTKEDGWQVLDKNYNVPYQIYVFDNGPDYPEDGLYRIRKNQKIGYADAHTGKIVIEPKYDCAYPFEKGIASVGFGCREVSDGDHHMWVGGSWEKIDKKGNLIKNKNH